MVNTAITTMPAFDSYYGVNTSGNSSKQNKTFTYILLGGFILVSGLSIYLAIRNDDLRKKMKPRIIQDN